MPAPASLKSVLRKLGWPERIFVALIALYLLLIIFAPGSGWTGFTQFVAFVFGLVIVIRLLRIASRHVIWRLRNRLIVTYLFIGGVPILLIAALVGFSLYGLVSQVAVYLVTAELDRRVEGLRGAAGGIAHMDPSARADAMRHMSDEFYKDRYPGITMLLRTPAGISRYPADSPINPPPPGTGDKSGIVNKDSQFFIWAHQNYQGGDFTVLAPMSVERLSNLVPNLGTAELLSTEVENNPNTFKTKVDDQTTIEVERPRQRSVRLPPPAFRLDSEVAFPSVVPFSYFNEPSKNGRTLLYVTSRLSAVYNVLFSRKSDFFQSLIPFVILILAIAFLVVELVSLVVGIVMTRTITGTVHHLYEGTQRIMHGDFSHRVEVTGRDQLSDLGHSFNQMTERIEKLLDVAKEKERLQSEIEIAREVQNQLYPKKVPDIPRLTLTAVCKPARMVSGDYFDYECVRDNCVALAVGDVAGKGISAALLMATLQSSLRTELRNSAEMAVAAGNGAHSKPISTSSLVGHLNEQLYAYTAPEKYATFYLAIYDDVSGILNYTNAGHLPPILVRNGEATRLNVDGTVVGAFPFARYDESKLQMQSGDLLVCFTDGVSEPENEFGEMFGEDRLMELVVRNYHMKGPQIVESIISAVEQWTGSPELQDDMTLLLARRD